MKKVTQSVTGSFTEAGKSLKTWRKIYALKAVQVAERAGISLGTLHKIENGDPSVSVAAFLEVVRSLGLLDAFTAFYAILQVADNFFRLYMENRRVLPKYEAFLPYTGKKATNKGITRLR